MRSFFNRSCSSLFFVIIYGDAHADLPYLLLLTALQKASKQVFRVGQVFRRDVCTKTSDLSEAAQLGQIHFSAIVEFRQDRWPLRIFASVNGWDPK